LLASVPTLMLLQVVQHDLGSTFGGFTNLADHPWLLASGGQGLQGYFDLILRHADDHAYAAVEYTVHLVLIDVAFFLQPVEDRRAGPAGSVDHRLCAFWQHARDVVEQATTGDVGHGFDRASV